MENLETQHEITGRNSIGETDNVQVFEQESLDDVPKDRICWPIASSAFLEHLLALYALKLVLEGNFFWSTLAFSIILGYASGFAITVGAHKLWAHRSYKAKWPLRLLLVILQVLAVQSSVWQWVAWHRAHHKHSEKELDPHNATRGFFYAHMGWLLTYDPARFRIQLGTVNMEDVEADSIVMWQDRNYDMLFIVMNVLLPVVIPWYYFGEDLWTAFVICYSLRVVTSSHFTALVNSAAHLYGCKPYDKTIYPSENVLVSFLALGEGWHNYHHAFPWDYRASEFGGFYRFNPSAAMIEILAKTGLAYDLKTASSELVAARMKRTGKA